MLVPLLSVAVLAVLIGGFGTIAAGMVCALSLALVYYVHRRTRRRDWQRGVRWISLFSCACAAIYTGAQLNYSIIALSLASVFLVLAMLEVGLLCGRFLKPKLE